MFHARLEHHIRDHSSEHHARQARSPHVRAAPTVVQRRGCDRVHVSNRLSAPGIDQELLLFIAVVR